MESVKYVKPENLFAYALPLAFRRGSALLRTQLAVIAFLVIGLPVLIGLAVFELHGPSSSERRQARVLLLFGRLIEESKPESPLKVSQSTLAEMVGTTRARVSKFRNGSGRRTSSATAPACK